VSVCGSDDAPGGLNLASALATGGPIRIKCAAGQQDIQITQTRNLLKDTTITSDAPATLHGPANKPMFTTAHALTLSKLTLTNPSKVTGSIVSGDQANVTLTSATVTNSPAAFLARSLNANDSRFTNNGDSSAEASASAVIDAETVDLEHSEFDANGDHPIAGGAWPTPGLAPLSRRVTINGSTFTHNRSTVLLIDAKVSINSSKFSQNGQAPATSHDTWGCCGGALTFVRSDAEISDSDFLGNGSSGFGGAIQSIGSRLTVRTSTFDGNEARGGGAIMSWARPPRVNIWSTDDWTDLPRLVLSQVTFKNNKATAHGGAVGFSGPVQGAGVVLQSNQAQTVGAAIASWQAAPLPPPYDGIADAMTTNTEAPLPDTLTLTRSILVDNHAGQSGAALATGDAQTSVGNSIVARNTATGAAVTGTKLRLINTVVADNSAPGIQTGPGGKVTLGNSVVLRNNNANCAPGTAPAVLGRNMQYPGSDCGSQIQTTDPGLDATYTPGLISAARNGGDANLCISEPTVAGVDLNGRTRISAEHTCAAGAIERSLLDSAAAALTFDHIQDFRHCLMWLLIILLLIAFIVGFVWRIRKRRKRRHSSTAAIGPPESPDVDGVPDTGPDGGN
jgi:hypothetical protein